MKNLGRIFTVCMVLCLMLGVAVFAADEELMGIDTVKIFEGVEASAYDYEVGDYNFALDYDDAKAGGMYLVLVLANPEDKEADDIKPTSGNILYVNQITSAGTTVTFEKVYPSEIIDSYVYLAGTDLALTALGEIIPYEEEVVPPPATGLKGDVDEDGDVDIVDLQRLFAHLNGSNPLVKITAGDVDGDGDADIVDLQRLFAHLNGSNPLS